MKYLVLVVALSAVASGCNREFTAPSGNITSPNYPKSYPKNADCLYTIKAEEGKKIYIGFLDILIEKAAKCFDYLEIFDGEESLGQFCGEENPGSYVSKTNTVTMRFVSDSTIELRGFAIEYFIFNDNTTIPTAAPGGCGGYFKGDSGTVTSPNYPEEYPAEADCDYVIELQSEGEIKLSFDDFQLEESRTCKFDFLEIRDVDQNGKVLGTFCGTASETIKASGKSLYMKFKSDYGRQFKGFSATWEKMSCESQGGVCNNTCTYGEIDITCEGGLKCCRPDVGLPEVCGIRPNVNSPQIVGGAPAVPNSWPWQVSLQRGTFHFCGGSLIAKGWALTAAHCVERDGSVTVVLGEHNRRKISGNERRIDTSKILVHEDFTRNFPYPSDIALLKLSETVEFNEYYSPICLPTTEDMEFNEGDGCYMTGWGDTKGPQDRNILQELQLDPITNDECSKLWGRGNILSSHICIGKGGTGSCQGDSGGPTACPKDDVWYLAGATSWGVRGCRTPGYPSVYTRVSKFLVWISKTMQNNV